MAERNVAVVTGAAGGIGREVVAALLKKGYKVAALDTNQERLNTLTESLGTSDVIGLAVDVTSEAEVQAAVRTSRERLGPASALINLAGNNILKEFLSISVEEWDFLMNVNLKSAFLCCKAVLPEMLEQGYGRIINTSSIFGVRGNANDAAYCSAKAGVVGLTRALATEFAERGITVNALAPVVTMTERVAAMPQEHLAAQLARIPMGRAGTVADLVNTILFLLSEGGDFYTGQVFSPNGGDMMA